MNSVLQSQKSNCRSCYKCIRHCPVKAIKFSGDQASIMGEECILCGICYQVCPQQVKQVRRDTATVKAAIMQGRRVYASVAPSFITEFPVESFDEMAAALKKLGFWGAAETAVGAQLVKTAYEQLLAGQNPPALISSCCPAVNGLIEKYYPQMLPYLAKVLSPMQAHGRYIKEEYPDAFTVFIGPCIAKKQESDSSIHMDVALTFEELWQWLEEERIEFVPPKERRNDGKRSQFFPTCGGIIKSMDKRADIDYVAIDGVQTCVAAFAELEQSRLTNLFIEMSACEGSCINGPCFVYHKHNRLSDMRSINAYAGSGDYELRKAPPLAAKYQAFSAFAPLPGEDEIRLVLKQIGKSSPERELNCGGCGYNTCREKAIAVCQGKADLNMCLPYLKEKAESFSGSIVDNMPETIMVLNEKLLVQDLNRAGCELFGLKHPQQAIGRPVDELCDAHDYRQVAETGQSLYNRNRYLQPYNKYVEETVLYDEDYHIIICLIRDITAKERMDRENQALRGEAVAIADKVIEKQMRIVQDIASLLGETTAETKIALTKLKDSLQK